MPTALFAAQQHHAFGAGAILDSPDLHYIHSHLHSDKTLYSITETDYVAALIPSTRTACAEPSPSRRTRAHIHSLQHLNARKKDARPLMAAVMHHHSNTMPLAAPGSPPDLRPGGMRILNWYLYAYLIAAATMFAAAWWFSRTDERLFQTPVRPSQLFPAAAVILLFFLLNIEIADYWATGPAIMFRFGAGVSQDLTYTLGWLVFGGLLLTAGIYLRNRPARVTAVALIAVTAFKGFLYDMEARPAG